MSKVGLISILLATVLVLGGCFTGVDPVDDNKNGNGDNGDGNNGTVELVAIVAITPEPDPAEPVTSPAEQSYVLLLEGDATADGLIFRTIGALKEWIRLDNATGIVDVVTSDGDTEYLVLGESDVGEVSFYTSINADPTDDVPGGEGSTIDQPFVVTFHIFREDLDF